MISHKYKCIFILDQIETTGFSLIEYNPNLNPIERAWNAMNEHVRNQ